ncbi:MAG: NAD-dependent epimerase/dehydratase family protein, partial [Deltaproteobacteria bacterium]|nr:NAD-dependent epimerase/dehydratase family protein [Nannocystaceae bacterium]
MGPDVTTLVTGASGFVGGALVRALRAADRPVIAASRRAHAPGDDAGLRWRVCDLHRPDSLPAALAG